MKLSLSSLAAIAIVGIAASTLPNAAGHLRSVPPPSLVEDKAHSSHGKEATPLTKGAEEVNHKRVGRKLPRKKKKGKKDKKKKTSSPSKSPSKSPSQSPSMEPSVSPTSSPTAEPSSSPTVGGPTSSPTKEPSSSPTVGPTSSPTKEPSKSPSKSPSQSPSMEPSVSPTAAEECECEQLQAVAAAKLQSIQTNVCGLITQVDSEKTKAAAVKMDAVKQAYDKMDAAMKEMTASCVPVSTTTDGDELVYNEENEIEASVAVVSNQELGDLEGLVLGLDVPIIGLTEGLEVANVDINIVSLNNKEELPWSEKEADETVVIKEDALDFGSISTWNPSSITDIVSFNNKEETAIATCSAATDAVIGMQAELIRTMSQYVQAVPDLSKLASTAECGAEKQQSVAEKQQSVDIGEAFEGTLLQYVKAEVDTDTDGN